MRRRFFTTLIISILTLGLAGGFAAAAPTIKLLINGTAVAADVAPVLQSGRTLVPLRVIMENLGAQVDWSDKTQTVTITGAGQTIVLQNGEKAATVNGTKLPLDVPAKIIKARTFVPLRFVGETMGANVNWDEATATVAISTKAAKLTEVQWSAGEGGASLKLVADAPVDFQTAFQADKNQLLINLPRTVAAVPESVTPVGAAGVREVRVGKATDGSGYAAVTVDLASGQPYRVAVSQDKLSLTIHFPYQVTAIGLKQTDEGDRLELATTGPVGYQLAAVNDTEFILELSGAVLALPGNEANVNNAYISTVRYAQATADTVRVTVSLLQPVRCEVEKRSDGLAVRFDPLLTEITLVRPGFDGRLTFVSPLPLTVEPTTDGNKRKLFLPRTTLSPAGGLRLGEDPAAPLVPFADLGQGYAGIPGVAALRVEAVDGEAPGVAVTLELAPGFEAGEATAVEPGRYTVPILARPLAGKTIVLDPGHGGSDVGAIGATGKYEKNVNHAIGQQLRERLERLGARVVVTNTVDSYLDGYTRANIANTAGADVFLSIHANAFTNPASHGTETYFWTTNPDSENLARIIHKHLMPQTGLFDRGVKSERFIVIRETTVPSALVEVAFISNPAEEKLLFDSVFQAKVSGGLRDGLLEYLVPDWFGANR